MISRLLTDRSSRESYIRAKLNQLVPSQIKALRLREDWTQKKLGESAEMKQARISAMEKPGEVAFTLETLVRLASAFRVGLQVRFVPYSEMLEWDNSYSQDTFSATPIEEDRGFLNPSSAMKYSMVEATGIPIHLNALSYTPSVHSAISAELPVPPSPIKEERMIA
jgi:transcriptional regulator with XRE-family HTH domain